MVEISSAANEVEFIESVRSIFRAYVPESDAWAQPNFFSINATIIGGLAWSAFNEARNGIDARVNPQSASGEYLDIIAGQPPLFLTRYGPTKAMGSIAVNIPSLTTIPAGYVFQTADGTSYTANSTTPLISGVGTVAVTSSGTGALQNSVMNRPMELTNGQAVSLGIYGGNDGETDEGLRARIFSSQQSAHFFGSACTYESALLAYPGVTRAWAIEDGLTAKITFLMEDTYPCGTPQQTDIDTIKDYFKDECRTNMFFCPFFEGAKTSVIGPEINWNVCHDRICEVEAAMQLWLRANYDIGEGVSGCDIQAFLDNEFPELGGTVGTCCYFPPIPCTVYNCVELVGG